MDTVQVFTKNQQQWKCKPLEQAQIGEWKSHVKRLKFKKTVSHDSYLINLCSTNGSSGGKASSCSSKRFAGV